MLNLLRNGSFGRLRLPATRSDVRTAFGEPELWGPQQDMERCAIWRYDSIEFHFQKRTGALAMIFSDHLSPFLIPYGWGVDPWIIGDNLGLTMTRHLLGCHGIDFSIEPQPTIDAINIITATAVTLSFFRDVPDDDDYRLGAWWKMVEEA
jgi:hypothetical protein